MIIDGYTPGSRKDQAMLLRVRVPDNPLAFVKPMAQYCGQNEEKWLDELETHVKMVGEWLTDCDCPDALPVQFVVGQLERLSLQEVEGNARTWVDALHGIIRPVLLLRGYMRLLEESRGSPATRLCALILSVTQLLKKLSEQAAENESLFRDKDRVLSPEAKREAINGLWRIINDTSGDFVYTIASANDSLERAKCILATID